MRSDNCRLGARGSGLGARGSGLGTPGLGLGTRGSGFEARRSGLGARVLLAVGALFVTLAAQDFSAATAHSAQAPIQQSNVIDRVLAVVAGGLILQSDVTAALKLGLVPVPPEGDRVQSALDRLIERRLMLIEVDRYGPPEPSGAAVDAAVAEIDERIGSGAQLDAILRESGFTVDQLRLYVRDDLRIRAYLQQRFGTSLTAGDEDVLAYYRTHSLDFTRQGVVRPFSEVREEARQGLLAERRAGLVREWLASLRRRTDVNVLYLPGK